MPPRIESMTHYLLLTMAAMLLALPAETATAAEKPNIIFILADDAGLGDFGCYGGRAVPTPHIDRLAAEGIRFVNAYSASAVCAPSRCGLMTGRHMGHALVRANSGKHGHLALRPEDITVTELLKEAGYATGGFGKWGLGNPGTTGVPEKQGFDRFYGYYDQQHAHNYFPAFLVCNSVDMPMLGGNGVPGRAGKGNAYSHDLILAETLQFIEKHREQPFFIYAAWTLPHGNFEVPAIAPEFADQPWPEPVKIHATMLKLLDDGVGQVLAKLQALGLDEKTLVIFSSDNGAAGPGVNTFHSATGLRGLKRSLYEGGIRAPFVARWPGQIPPGRTNDLLTSHVDFLATACELAGQPAPPNDGISIRPTLLGQEQTIRHEALYWEIYEGAPFQQAVRLGDWKGYRTSLAGPLELYNLQTDPAEKTNVAGQHPAVVNQIEAIMAREHVRNPNWEPK